MTKFEKIYEAVSNKVSLGQITTEDLKSMMDIAFEKHVTENYDEPEFDDEGTEEVTEAFYADDWNAYVDEWNKSLDTLGTEYIKLNTEYYKLKNNKPVEDNKEYEKKLLEVGTKLSNVISELTAMYEKSKITRSVLIDNEDLNGIIIESVNPKQSLDKVKSKAESILKKCESLFKEIESKANSPETKAKFAKLKEKIKIAKINGMKKGKALAEKFKASAKKAAEKAKSTIKKESEDVEETKAAIFESLENDDIDVDTAMELLSMLND